VGVVKETVDLLKTESGLYIDSIKERMIALSQMIHENPEISMEEHQASQWLSNELAQHSFATEKGTAGLETAFSAAFKVGSGQPTVCFLVEYDALPDLGHACGHNAHGVTSLAAALATKEILRRHGIDGTVLALGTPAEEIYSGKVTIVESGYFDSVDIAMMVHCFDNDLLYVRTSALDALQIDFKGKVAHASFSPEEGINALNAVLLTFNGIDALRQQTADDVRINGIIVEGGVAPNMVPEQATARFYVRANQRTKLDEVTQKVINCARGAALMTGAEVEISSFEKSLDNIKLSIPLCKAYKENWMQVAGTPLIETLPPPGASTDLGNVSQVVPTIMPTLSISDQPAMPHTPEFAAAAGSDMANERLILGAKVLAATAIDVITNPELLSRIKAEFAEEKAES
jgi:amidohydrolase